MKRTNINYLGQTTYNRDGYEMVILETRNTHDITVDFPEVGIIKHKKYYRDFLHGLISIKNDLIPKRVGERKQMKNGEWCTIIKYNDSNDIEVQFDSGYKKSTTYSHFINRDIGNHDKKKKLLKKTFITKNSNEKYKIIKEYDDTNEVLVQFIANGKEYKYKRADAMRGIIASEKHLQKRSERFSEGKILISKNGVEYTITKFNEDDKTIDIKSINGYESRVDPFSVENRCELTKSELCAKRLDTQNKNQIKKIESLIGSAYYATNGAKITIVGGSGYMDIWVEDEDGIIYKNNKLRDVKKNRACIISSSDTRSRRVSRGIEGATITSTAGYKVKAIKYYSAQKVKVEIEIAPGRYEQRYVTAHQFRVRQCNPTCTNEVNGASINEHAFLSILKPYGFKKAKKGSLSKLKGFGNFEIDIYNEEHSLAIEYDGYYHQKEEVIQRDLKKDKLLKSYGFKIIRIRAGVPLLNDGFAEEIQMNDLHFCSPEMREVADKLADMINKLTGMMIAVPDMSNLEFQERISESYAKKTSRRKHLGEEIIDRNGNRGHIIEYIDRMHVRIQFENGYITPYFDYGRISKIRCEENHFGEVNKSRRNQKMTIISDKYDSKKVDVMFEDGTILKNQSYTQFKNGTIVNPNYDSTEKYIGMSVTARNGKVATVEKAEVIPPAHYTQLYGSFEDGKPFKCRLGHFRHGYIKHE